MLGIGGSEGRVATQMDQECQKSDVRCIFSVITPSAILSSRPLCVWAYQNTW